MSEKKLSTLQIYAGVHFTPPNADLGAESTHKTTTVTGKLPVFKEVP